MHAAGNLQHGVPAKWIKSVLECYASIHNLKTHYRVICVSHVVEEKCFIQMKSFYEAIQGQLL
jgi:hypothetical protein